MSKWVCIAIAGYSTREQRDICGFTIGQTYSLDTSGRLIDNEDYSYISPEKANARYDHAEMYRIKFEELIVQPILPDNQICFDCGLSNQNHRPDCTKDVPVAYTVKQLLKHNEEMREATNHFMKKWKMIDGYAGWQMPDGLEIKMDSEATEQAVATQHSNHTDKCQKFTAVSPDGQDTYAVYAYGSSMAVLIDDEVVVITKADAMKFFGLVEK